MEYRIKDYQIDGNSIVLPRATSIEDIRLIYNETQKVLICSTAKKDNLRGLGVIIVNQFNNTTTINVPTSICVLQPNDQLTIKCDYGDDLSSVESKVEEVGSKIDNIDPTLIENKVDEGVSTLSTKIDNIDLSSVAKQGENTGATNTAILAEIKAITDLKNIYSVRFEQNSDGDNTWTMVMPVVSGVIMNEDDTVTIQM